ncbi:MAG: molybdate ABC transporter substrate-binding protein [Acidimicrobiales bacterium]|nr:molybdate ABC transporter substrate-binding protein [Acidimicrobiales bacterium]
MRAHPARRSVPSAPVRGLSVMLALLVSLAACGDDGVGVTGDGEPEGTVLVFAAASLTDAFDEIEVAFEAAHPGVDVMVNTAGSSALREQILEGAPADVFASANRPNIEQLMAAGEVAGEVEVLATNSLQIVVPAGNPGGVTGVQDLARPELLIGLCAEGVPCGDFAREVLARAAVQASIDTNEPDVRALLTKVGADELDAGVVYATDVIAGGELVEGIDIPSQWNVEADYPIARMAGGSNPTAADAFIEFVLGSDGQRILAGFGFSPP